MATAYANALVEVAQKTNSLEAVHSDVDALSQIMKDNEVCCRHLRCWHPLPEVSCAG